MGVSSSSVLTQKSPDWDAYLKVHAVSVLVRNWPNKTAFPVNNT